jgi:hypothetical protein
MKTKHTHQSWRAAKTGNHQGLIISETTGENIAVAYDSKNAALIAAAPELLEVVKALVSAGGIMEPSDWFVNARAALAKAIGES